MRLQAKVNALPVLCSSGREYQSASGEELSALSPAGRFAVPSVLACTVFFSDKAFKEEL